MKLFATLALPLCLSGCWTGPTFYAPSETVQAIPAGKYKIHREHSKLPDYYNRSYERHYQEPNEVRISYNGSGRTVVKNGGEIGEETATVVPFNKAEGTYIAQIDKLEATRFGGQAVYALIRVTPRGYDLAVPICADEHPVEVDADDDAGLPGVKLPSCKFRSRKDLETAMADYAQSPLRWTEYWRKGER